MRTDANGKWHSMENLKWNAGVTECRQTLLMSFQTGSLAKPNPSCNSLKSDWIQAARISWSSLGICTEPRGPNQCRWWAEWWEWWAAAGSMESISLLCADRAVSKAWFMPNEKTHRNTAWQLDVSWCSVHSACLNSFRASPRSLLGRFLCNFFDCFSAFSASFHCGTVPLCDCDWCGHILA